MYFCQHEQVNERCMNKILFALTSVLAFVSCANSYNIEGSSNLSTLDGQKLYLKVFADDDMKCVDSCDVVHGKFAFSGSMDSTQWANIYMDQSFLVPVVLESGDIVIRIDNTQTTISGTPQNEELNSFLRSYAQFQNQYSELVRSNTQMLMNGLTEEEANRHSSIQLGQLVQKADKQFTTFIANNFDNAVGPCAFMLLTMGNQYPTMEVWMEDLLSKASASFKNDGYVRFYCTEAKKLQDMLNGMDSTPALDNSGLSATPPMTPNEMAGDSTSGK